MKPTHSTQSPTKPTAQSTTKPTAQSTAQSTDPVHTHIPVLINTSSPSAMTNVGTTAAGVVAGNLIANKIMEKSTDKCNELFQKYEFCIASDGHKNCNQLLDDFKKCYYG